MKMDKTIYIGAMSGTSHDAIDVSIVDIKKTIVLKYFYSQKIPPAVNEKIRKQIESNQTTLSELGKLNKEMGSLFSKVISKAIEKSKIKKSKIACVSISGQTIRHEIHKKDSFSMQITDPNIIASETSLPVVSDFRNMHIALGGQGAPLVPEFHQEIFYKKNSPRIILNIGGISNYSYLKGKKELWGSDVGPGNALMDAYCNKYLNLGFDKGGQIAAKGKVIKSELKKLLSHKFFAASFPKSTGKEIFNIEMLSKSLLKKDSCDVLATLVEFTAKSIAKAILKNKHASKNIIVCGGGGNNTYLLERISKLSNREVILSDDEGYNIQSIESMAFAWLGYKRINNQDLKIQLGKNKFNKGILGSITRARR